MPKTGWLERQVNKNVKDVKGWPAWMREGAIKLDPPEPKEKSKNSSSCNPETDPKKGSHLSS